MLSVSASALLIFEARVEERRGQCWQENNVNGTLPYLCGDHSRSKNIYWVKCGLHMPGTVQKKANIGTHIV
jgi:hypothetical protein